VTTAKKRYWHGRRENENDGIKIIDIFDNIFKLVNNFEIMRKYEINN